MSNLVSVRTRLEQAAAAWAQAALGPLPEFISASPNPSFGFFPGRRGAELTYPCIVCACETATEVEAPGMGIYRAELQFVLMTSIDEPSAKQVDSDSAATLHTARLDTLVNQLQDITALRQALADRGSMQVFGIVPEAQPGDQTARHFFDVIRLEVYCQTV